MKWNKDAEKAGERRRVFCASMADLFEDNPDIQVKDARIRTFRLVESTPNLDWLLLTKRPENVMDFVPELWKCGGWPTNAWFGFTAENQERFDGRNKHAIFIPAKTFISIEPMLGKVVLKTVYGVSWVIFGAESGPHRRECKNEWILDGIRQIREEYPWVKIFVKQIHLNGKVSKNPAEWPEELRVQEFPD